MKLIYKDDIYPLYWKTQMRNDSWYSMEPAKMRVTMPSHVYESIKFDRSKYNSLKLNEPFTFKFDVYKDNELVTWGVSAPEYNGFWNIEVVVYSMLVSSKFRNGNLLAIFEVGVYNADEKDKSEAISLMRDLTLSQLICF